MISKIQITSIFEAQAKSEKRDSEFLDVSVVSLLLLTIMYSTVWTACRPSVDPLGSEDSANTLRENGPVPRSKFA